LFRVRVRVRARVRVRVRVRVTLLFNPTSWAKEISLSLANSP
jgi:hypothetical protein